MRLIQWLAENNLTASQLAATLNTSPVAVGRYIKGARMPTPEIVERIRQVTGGSVTALDLHDARMEFIRARSDAA